MSFNAFFFCGKGEAGEAHLVWWLVTQVGSWDCVALVAALVGSGRKELVLVSF